MSGIIEGLKWPGVAAGITAPHAAARKYRRGIIILTSAPEFECPPTYCSIQNSCCIRCLIVRCRVRPAGGSPTVSQIGIERNCRRLEISAFFKRIGGKPGPHFLNSERLNRPVSIIKLQVTPCFPAPLHECAVLAPGFFPMEERGQKGWMCCRISFAWRLPFDLPWVLDQLRRR